LLVVDARSIVACPVKNRPTKLLPAVLIVVVAVWETVSTLRAGQDVPDDAAWAEAAELVRADHHPGDLIVFAPSWIDPVGRKHLGDLISIDDAARLDAARFAILWEVSIRDARAAETSGLLPEWEKRIGGVTVRKFRQTPAVVTTDFLAQLGRARTEGRRAQGPSLELAEVGFAPHRCIQVVPQPGESVRITFPGALLGAQLVGYVGLADVFKRRDVRDPARLAVEIGGREVASATVGVDSGWVRFAATTLPGPADVTFVATAIGAKARDRLVCFAAEARR
jgi:hypothetical protein